MDFVLNLSRFYGNKLWATTSTTTVGRLQILWLTTRVSCLLCHSVIMAHL